MVIVELPFGREAQFIGYGGVFLCSFPCSLALVVLYFVAAPQTPRLAIRLIEQAVKAVAVLLAGHDGSIGLKMFRHVLDRVRVFTGSTLALQARTGTSVLSSQSYE